MVDHWALVIRSLLQVPSPEDGESSVIVIRGKRLLRRGAETLKSWRRNMSVGSIVALPGSGFGCPSYPYLGGPGIY